jgi:beta-phosphoglucomutase-like phosphatase (HAD superfamily)
MCWIVLDMDGVILDSEAVKKAAFRQLFAAYPQQQDQIDAYNCQNRGIPRGKKFEYVIEHFLKLPIDSVFLQSLHEQYSHEVMQQMETVELVAGIPQFLQLDEFVFYLNSSAPIDEIKRILQGKRIWHHFRQIFGYPSSKAQVLQDLKQMANGRHLLFFGDAPADYEAAKMADIPFVAVCTTSNPFFDNLPDVPVIRDFANLDEIILLIKGEKR